MTEADDDDVLLRPVSVTLTVEEWARVHSALKLAQRIMRLSRAEGSPEILESLSRIEPALSAETIARALSADREPDPGSDNPDCGHEWAYTGEAYGGDEPGEGRCYCIYCGADGDA